MRKESTGWGQSATLENSSDGDMTTKTTVRLDNRDTQSNGRDRVWKHKVKGNPVGTDHCLRKLAIHMKKQNRFLPHGNH